MPLQMTINKREETEKERPYAAYREPPSIFDLPHPYMPDRRGRQEGGDGQPTTDCRFVSFHTKLLARQIRFLTVMVQKNPLLSIEGFDPLPHIRTRQRHIAEYAERLYERAAGRALCKPGRA